MRKNPSCALLLSLLLAAAAILLCDAAGGVLPVELWCVAKNNADDSALQAALDWACGPGGAYCAPVMPGGGCYDVSDLQIRASFAFNDYFLKHNLTDDSCNFGNTAALTSLNPSRDGCKFPSSFSVSKGKTGTSSGGVGLGPAEDYSSGVPTAGGWILINIPLFLIIALSTLCIIRL